MTPESDRIELRQDRQKGKKTGQSDIWPIDRTPREWQAFEKMLHKINEKFLVSQYFQFTRSMGIL